MTSLAELQLDLTRARLHLRNSAYIDHQYHLLPQEWSYQIQGHSSGPDSLRQFGVGDYFNDYTRYVDEMSAVEPLPVLIPRKTFPDPFTKSSSRVDDVGKTEKWPCKLGKHWQSDTIQVQTRFPRSGKDWLHNWAEYMYMVGEFGAKQMK
ncbi:hypothetical protein Btru_036079 [Bulinus truncatus]|nr:hypothetical protein Btru_036079 [Bulinus truncatus]